MIATLGNLGLLSALILALIQSYPSPWRPRTLAALTCSSLWLAMLCLIWGYIASDFSIENVFLNSHEAKPLLYKITGSWGNHEGSMLLLNAILGCYGLALACKKAPYQSATTSLFNLIFLGFLGFSFFTSNPFVVLSPPPEVGQGLNPLLQDIGLALHPPILYIGYVGFSIVFASTLIHIYHHHLDQNWARFIKPWVVFSWGFLTLGIGLGSWWAYRELGWGGFWFWDPVENASLLPWLCATALVHSLLVLEKRNHLPQWTALLAILTFTLCLVGIFLVRSGILTSVHSFALDPERGMYFLAFLAIALCGSLGLLVYKSTATSANKTPFKLLSKEGSLLFNNLFLTVLCFTVLLGILYPIIIEVIYATKISVGSGFYNASFNSLSFPLLALLCIAPYLNWKHEKKLSTHLKSLAPTLLLTAIAFSWFWIQEVTLMCLLGLTLGIAVMLSTLTYLWKQTRQFKQFKTQPSSFYRMIIGHFGLGLLAFSISANSAFKQEKDLVFTLGQTHEIGQFNITLTDMHLDTGANYFTRRGIFSVQDRQNQLVTHLLPEVRYYVAEAQNTTESDIYYSLWHNLYIAMGDTEDAIEFAVRIYIQPFINLLWLACLLMTISGIWGIRSKR